METRLAGGLKGRGWIKDLRQQDNDNRFTKT